MNEYQGDNLRPPRKPHLSPMHNLLRSDSNTFKYPSEKQTFNNIDRELSQISRIQQMHKQNGHIGKSLNSIPYQQFKHFQQVTQAKPTEHQGGFFPVVPMQPQVSKEALEPFQQRHLFQHIQEGAKKESKTEKKQTSTFNPSHRKQAEGAHPGENLSPGLYTREKPHQQANAQSLSPSFKTIQQNQAPRKGFDQIGSSLGGYHRKGQASQTTEGPLYKDSGSRPSNCILFIRSIDEQGNTDSQGQLQQLPPGGKEGGSSRLAQGQKKNRNSGAVRSRDEQRWSNADRQFEASEGVGKHLCDLDQTAQFSNCFPQINLKKPKLTDEKPSGIFVRQLGSGQQTNDSNSHSHRKKSPESKTLDKKKSNMNSTTGLIHLAQQIKKMKPSRIVKGKTIKNRHDESLFSRDQEQKSLAVGSNHAREPSMEDHSCERQQRKTKAMCTPKFKLKKSHPESSRSSKQSVRSSPAKLQRQTSSSYEQLDQYECHQVQNYAGPHNNLSKPQIIKQEQGTCENYFISKPTQIVSGKDSSAGYSAAEEEGLPSKSSRGAPGRHVRQHTISDEPRVPGSKKRSLGIEKKSARLHAKSRNSDTVSEKINRAASNLSRGNPRQSDSELIPSRHDHQMMQVRNSHQLADDGGDELLHSSRKQQAINFNSMHDKKARVANNNVLLFGDPEEPDGAQFELPFTDDTPEAPHTFILKPKDNEVIQPLKDNQNVANSLVSQGGPSAGQSALSQLSKCHLPGTSDKKANLNPLRTSYGQPLTGGGPPKGDYPGAYANSRKKDKENNLQVTCVAVSSLQQSQQQYYPHVQQKPSAASAMAKPLKKIDPEKKAALNRQKLLKRKRQIEHDVKIAQFNSDLVDIVPPENQDQIQRDPNGIGSSGGNYSYFGGGSDYNKPSYFSSNNPFIGQSQSFSNQQRLWQKLKNNRRPTDLMKQAHQSGSQPPARSKQVKEGPAQTGSAGAGSLSLSQQKGKSSDLFSNYQTRMRMIRD